MLPVAPSRRLGGPCPFRRRDLASGQVGKAGPGSSKTVWSPLGTHFHPSLCFGLVAPSPALDFRSLTPPCLHPQRTEKLWRTCYISNISISNISLYIYQNVKIKVNTQLVPIYRRTHYIQNLSVFLQRCFS